MANLQTGNLYYIDATGSLAKPGIRVHSLLVTATAASAIVKLKDSTIAGTLVDARVATSGSSEHFWFDPPMVFPSGLEVSTCTNAVATAVIDYNRGG